MMIPIFYLMRSNRQTELITPSQSFQCRNLADDFKLSAVSHRRICNRGLVFAMLRGMLLNGFRECQLDKLQPLAGLGA
jgi:hypothetical protein